jgi:hypothetical protein
MGIPLTLIGSYGPDRVLIGGRHGGHLIYDRGNPATPHLRISGSSGGGKGGAARVFLCHEMIHRNRVIIINPSGEFGWCQDAVSYARTPEEILAALTWGVNEMESRLDDCINAPHPTLGTRGVDTAAELPNPPERVTFLIDELPAVTGDEAPLVYHAGKAADLARLATPLVAALAKRGRKTLMNLVTLNQRPTLEGTFKANMGGGAIVVNFKAVIHFDRDAMSLQHAYQGTAKIPQSVLDEATANVPGRGIYAYLDPADGGRPGACQILWVTQEQARPFAERYVTLEGPEPISFAPAPASAPVSGRKVYTP